MSEDEQQTMTAPDAATTSDAAAETAADATEAATMREAIEQAIAGNETILFMKGIPEAPACGFSARAIAALEALEVPFAAVNILPDPRIRQELSAISGWPTIPQLFVRGELVGGSDIIAEMYATGELHDLLGVARPAATATELDQQQSGSQPIQIENRLP